MINKPSRQSIWAKKNKDKVNAYMRKWKKANRDKVNAYNKKSYHKKKTKV